MIAEVIASSPRNSLIRRCVSVLFSRTTFLGVPTQQDPSDALALAETEGISAADLLADRDGEAAALAEGARVPLPLAVAARDALVEREGVRVAVTAEEAEIDGAALPLGDCVDAALDAGD